jgi:hypothetical protein
MSVLPFVEGTILRSAEKVSSGVPAASASKFSVFTTLS